jgi:hypothetical protein
MALFEPSFAYIKPLISLIEEDQISPHFPYCFAAEIPPEILILSYLPLFHPSKPNFPLS